MLSSSTSSSLSLLRGAASTVTVHFAHSLRAHLSHSRGLSSVRVSLPLVCLRHDVAVTVRWTIVARKANEPPQKAFTHLSTSLRTPLTLSLSHSVVGSCDVHPRTYTLIQYIYIYTICMKGRLCNSSSRTLLRTPTQIHYSCRWRSIHSTDSNDDIVDGVAFWHVSSLYGDGVGGGRAHGLFALVVIRFTI